MTFFEWVEDRLGHFVLQAVFVIVSTTVLLSTGTSIGIITLLLIMWFVTKGWNGNDKQCFECKGILSGISGVCGELGA